MKYQIAITFLIFVCLFTPLACIHAAPLRPIDTQLLDACHGRDLHMIELLIQRGADINAHEGKSETNPDESGSTPLCLAAAQKDNAAIIIMLVKHGANIEGRNDNKSTPLLVAAYAESPSNMECLLKLGANPEARDILERTPLFHVAGQDMLGVVHLLIQKGADVNAHEDKSGISPLWVAAAQKDNAAVIRMLVQHGAKVNAQDGDGETALMSAAFVGDISNIECLLKLGAKLEARDKSGKTALFNATAKPAAFRYLLDHHANFKTRDNDGSQPIHYAVMNGKIECVKWLVELGADVNACTKEGLTPIGYVSFGQQDLAKYLVAHGADINAKDKNGPIWSADLYNPQLTAFFLEHGAHINARNKKGWTALHKAASERNADIVQLLISHGADVNAKTPKGETAYALAAKRRDRDYERDDIVALLIKAGERDAKPIPKKPDILLSPDSDEAAVIRALNSGGSINGKEYSLVDQDTVGGVDAGKMVIESDPGDSPKRRLAAKKFREDLDKKMTHDLVDAFINSTEPSKVIPAYTDLPMKRFARDFDISSSFRHGGFWKEFYKKYPGANGIEHFSLPVFDKEHRHALIYHSGSSGGLSGGGQLLLVEKSDAGWNVVQEVELWVC